MVERRVWRLGEPPPEAEAQARLEEEIARLLGEWHRRGYVRLGRVDLEWLRPGACVAPEDWDAYHWAWFSRRARELLEQERARGGETETRGPEPSADAPSTGGRGTLGARVRGVAATGGSVRALLLAATREGRPGDVREAGELVRVATAIRDGAHVYGLRTPYARALAEGWHALLDGDGIEAAARAVGG